MSNEVIHCQHVDFLTDLYGESQGYVNADTSLHSQPLCCCVHTSHMKKDLPVFNGAVNVEFARLAVPYHIASCMQVSNDTNHEFVNKIVTLACRLSCISIDIVRGRGMPKVIQQYMSQECLKRLKTMEAILYYHMQRHPSFGTDLLRLPVIPCWINGMITGEKHIEIAIALTVGSSKFLANEVLEMQGSKWVCVCSDVGAI